MALLSPYPVMRFCDNNNNPLVGGQLFTYQAGTSTPAATYTDSTGTTANSNPVILNARGEANVWLLPGQTYKFVLEDSVGNVIWTVDNINPAPNSGVVNTLTNVAGSNTITGVCSGINQYQAGDIFSGMPASSNTGATTLNINGLGQVNVTIGGSALTGGEIVSGKPFVFYYTGSTFELFGMQGQVGDIAPNATNLVGIGNAAAFDLRYTLSGADGSGADDISISSATTLTASQSGKVIRTTGSTAFTITLPALQLGLKYRIYGCGGAITVAVNGGASTLYLPDGSSAASYVLPLSTLDFIDLYCNGSVWQTYTIGRTVVANAVNANEAAAYNQSLGNATNSGNIAASRAYGTVYTNSSNRHKLVKMSSTNVSATIQLNGYVNGAVVDTGLLAAGTAGGFVQITLFVPPGQTYEVESVSGGSAINSWQETV